MTTPVPPPTTDAQALLRAIAAHHDEDTPRLIYADAIEESDPARAELIRVQVEWERLKSISHPDTDAGRRETQRVLDVGVRERELLAANAERWRKGPACVTCNGSGVNPFKHSAPTAPADCPQCWAGDAGGLMRKVGMAPAGRKSDWLHEITYHRGMKRVHCRAADVWEGVPPPYLDGGFAHWRPTAWAMAACRHHPDVCELWVTDKKPFRYIDEPDKCGWSRDRPTYRDAQENVLPPAVWDLLPLGNVYPAIDAARAALARAAVAFVRSHL